MSRMSVDSDMQVGYAGRTMMKLKSRCYRDGMCLFSRIVRLLLPMVQPMVQPIVRPVITVITVITVGAVVALSVMFGGLPTSARTTR